jgi:hypothetical protein
VFVGIDVGLYVDGTFVGIDVGLLVGGAKVGENDAGAFVGLIVTVGASVGVRTMTVGVLGIAIEPVVVKLGSTLTEATNADRKISAFDEISLATAVLLEADAPLIIACTATDPSLNMTWMSSG